MTLGAFQPKTRIQGDKLDLKAYNGRPLLVRVMEFVPDFTSQQYPTPKPVIFCDVVDLYTSQIFINTLFGAGAVVDNLKDLVGTGIATPVRPVMKNSTKRQNVQYIALDALTEAELAQATQWYEQYWPYVDQTRAQREAAAVPAVPAAPAAPVQGGFVPQAQAQQFQAPVNQAPQGFGAPGGQPPAAPMGAPVGGPAPQGFPPAGTAQQFPVNQAPQGFGAPQGVPGAPATNPPAAPAYGAPQGQPQGFGAPQGGGLFTNQPPAPQPGQGFGAPVGDQAAANAALAHLNAQVQG